MMKRFQDITRNGMAQVKSMTWLEWNSHLFFSMFQAAITKVLLT